MTQLLIDETPLIVLPSLAKAIGLEEAIVLQQIHYHIKVHDPAMKEWIPCSVTTLVDWCPFISKRSMERVVNSLRSKGLIEVAQRPGYDRTNWLRVCYETLASIYANTEMHTASLAASHTANLAVSLIKDIKEEEESHIPVNGEVQGVFDHWKSVHGHAHAKLDSKRTRRIRDALKLYPREQVLACIEGYKRSEFHQGKNKDGKVFDSLELMLRDAEHIDAGIALAKGGAQKWL